MSGIYKDHFENLVTKEGGTAFPTPYKLPGGGDGSFTGMTLRDYFAAQVLIGAASQEDQPLDLKGKSYEGALCDYWASVAKAAYVAADEMIKARAEQ